MRKYLIMCLLAGVAQPALAQDEDSAVRIVLAEELDETSITVLANGVREAVYLSGKSISAFDRRDMDAVQGADLSRLLERAPGVTLTRNGGPGNFTAARVRGAEGEQLLVLLDGVRVGDPAAPGGGFDFGNLLMGNLSKIELQRSSNSTIWGSDAIGGVLAATSGSSGTFTGSVEYGANDSFYATGGAWLSAGPATLNVQAGRLRSDGISAAAAGTEPDGFRQTEFAGRADVELGGGLSAFASGRHADGLLDIDGFPAPAFALADTAEYQETRQRSGAAGLSYWSEELELTATASLADTERDSFDPTLDAAPGYTTDGASERGELRGRWTMAQSWALDFGAEREWTRFSTLFDPEHRTATAGAYAQLGYSSGSLQVAAGLRRDEHRDFGGAWSFGADAVYALGFVRLTASYGEGFKAPTLFQLLSDYGNAALRPERSRSYDVGISAPIGPFKATLTAFRRDTRDQIGFVSCFGLAAGICEDRPFGTYDNVGRARAQGLEAEVHAFLGNNFEIGGAYTLLDAEDRTPGAPTRGNDLARRPGHAATATFDWRAADPVRLGADLRVVSRSFDDAGNAVPLGGYEVVIVRGEWDANGHVTLFGRIENLFDEHYQTAAGYGTPGRGAYIGARARF